MVTGTIRAGMALGVLISAAPALAFQLNHAQVRSLNTPKSALRPSGVIVPRALKVSVSPGGLHQLFLDQPLSSQIADLPEEMQHHVSEILHSLSEGAEPEFLAVDPRFFRANAFYDGRAPTVREPEEKPAAGPEEAYEREHLPPPAEPTYLRYRANQGEHAVVAFSEPGSPIIRAAAVIRAPHYAHVGSAVVKAYPLESGMYLVTKGRRGLIARPAPVERLAHVLSGVEKIPAKGQRNRSAISHP